MGVGLFLAESLEESFVDGVEKGLFLGVVANVGRGFFDGLVEGVELLEEFIAAEVFFCERVDDLFDFGGDDVAAEEFVVVEDLAEDALCECPISESRYGAPDARIVAAMR